MSLRSCPPPLAAARYLLEVLALMEWIGAVWPIHFRHTVSALEEIRRRQAADIQAIPRLWVTVNLNRPFWIEEREMIGDDWKKSLCAAQTTRPEIDWTTCRLRLCAPKIHDRDARRASRINGYQ